LSLLTKNIRSVLALHIIVVVAVQLYLLSDVAQLKWEYVIKDTTLNTIFLCAAVWLIYMIVEAYPTPVAIILYAIIVSTFFSITIATTEWQILKWWLTKSDDNYYTTWALHTLPLRVFINWLLFGWIATYVAFRKKSEAIEDKFLEQSDASILLREAELFKLRQQLQPHFLYNSLNSISALVMIQPDKAQEMIGKLSDFLRNSVKRESEDRTPLEEELVYIQAYLAIESIRFGDRLQVAFEKEYTDDATIPPFLLQPVLENAIKFGLYGKTGTVIIKMHIKLQSSLLTIEITNPYDPQTSPPKGTGFGLEGIQRRLYLLFARTDLLETKKDGNTFTTILKIPQTNVQGNTN